jgi:hydroxymethylpyrimidine pyrophosphatase-like HAD family hydrolase
MKFEQFPLPNLREQEEQEKKEREKSAEQEKALEQLREAYVGSELMKKVEAQENRGEAPKALFTDIDNTFFRPGREGAMQTLNQKAAERDVPIVAVTGNDFQGVSRRMASGELPHFDAIIGGVGTEVWVRHEDERGGVTYRRDEYFDSLLQASGFERRRLAEEAVRMIEELRAKFPEAKLDFQDPQAEKDWLAGQGERQPYKISFHFFVDQERLAELTQVVAERFSDQAVVVCGEIGYNSTLAADAAVKKYCLDILPATKGDATEYVAKIVGVKQGLVAGDSGNDVGMLLETKALNSVLVGGYTSEAKEMLDQAVGQPKAGKQGFQKIVQPDGTVKAIYVEPGKRQAAESILRAAEILSRAQRIREIRNVRKL